MPFDQGQCPTIVCVNLATTPLGVDFSALVKAMQEYVETHIVPVWGTRAELVEADALKPGAWGMVFFDDADVAGALAYHDLTSDGFPLSKVFVRTTLRNGESVAVSASHELVEALVDPSCVIMVAKNDGTMVAYESADPVEESTFDVQGIPMSNFVYPSYFEEFRKPHSVKFDHLGLVKRPFEILHGGYLIEYRNGRWSNVFGSKEKARRFSGEDRRGHRTEQRMLRTLP